MAAVAAVTMAIHVRQMRTATDCHPPATAPAQPFGGAAEYPMPGVERSHRRPPRGVSHYCHHEATPSCLYLQLHHSTICNSRQPSRQMSLAACGQLLCNRSRSSNLGQKVIRCRDGSCSCSLHSQRQTRGPEPSVGPEFKSHAASRGTPRVHGSWCTP